MDAASSWMTSRSEAKSDGIPLIATTGSTPCARMFSSCLRRFAAPSATSSGFSLSMSSGSGRPGDDLVLARVALQRAHRRDHHGGVRLEAGDAALDVEEPLGAHVGAEARLGDQEVAGVDADEVGHHARVAVRDVAERAGVHEDRGVLQRLQQVRLERLAHHHRGRAGRLQLLGGDRLARLGVADDDAAQAFPQVLQALRQRKNRHHLARRGDVEARLPRDAVSRRAKADHDVAQRPVVDVDHPLPGDLVQVKAERVAHVEAVVHHRGDLVVRRGDRVHVAGQVQVEQLERDRLGVAAARRAALDAERGAHGGLPDGDRRLLADMAERHAEADRRGGLALAERRGGDGGDDDVLGLRAVLEFLDGLEVDLRDVLAVLLDEPGRDADVLGDFC